MKKILVLVLLLLSGLPGFCADTYWYPSYPTFFLHNKSLSLFSKTYKHNELEYYGCFSFLNEAQAKLKGRVFASETACIYFDYGNFKTEIDRVYFHFNDKEKFEHIQGQPFYFKKPEILREVMLALTVAGDGWLGH